MFLFKLAQSVMYSNRLLFFYLACSLTFSLANGQSLITLELRANKLLYDGKRDKVYAAVNSSDVNYGNSLVQINPYSGTIENSVFVGSEPVCMDITKDTDYVYIGLGGASTVKRVNLNSFLVDQNIPLGTGSFGPRYAEDVATVRLTPDLVVVSLKRLNVSPRHDGVAAFLRGVQLPGMTPDHTGSNVIESANDTDLVFGYNNESTEYGFRRMQIDSVFGVTLYDVNTHMSLGNDFEFADGLLYSDKGNVLNPFAAPPAFSGTFSNILPNSTVETDPVNSETFFSCFGLGLTISSYHAQTFSLAGSIVLDSAVPAGFHSPQSADMIRYGERGLAMIIRENNVTPQDRRVILYESCFVKPGPDLVVRAELADSIIYENDTSELVIRVTNAGNSPSSFISILDTLNASFEVLSSSASSGTIQQAGNTVQWNMDSMTANQSDSARIQIRFTQPGAFGNEVLAAAPGFDCHSLDNGFSDSVRIRKLPPYYSRIFPNPCQDFSWLDFKIDREQLLKMTITDAYGRLFYSDWFTGQEGRNVRKIDLAGLASGLYLLRVETADELMVQKKVIKQK
jgi:hypothetical protein